MESKGPGTQVQGRKSVLFWADYIQTEYYQQDYDADLCNLSACNFYVYCSPHSGGMGFRLGKLVLKQLGIWFGLPIVVAIIVSSMVIIYFIQTISAEISAYIGFGALMSQIGMTVSILALLLICYFISTWLLFKKSIK